MAKSPSFNDRAVTLPEPSEGGMQIAEVETTRPFLLCARDDNRCMALGEELEAKYGIAILTVSSIRGRDLTPPEFNYTTPSVRKARGQGWTAAQRREFCQMIEAIVFKKDGTPKKVMKPTGYLKDGVRIDARCKGSASSLSDPCSGNKGKEAGSCPVELVFIAGQGHLRLCETPKKGGKVLKFSDKAEALEIGRRACEYWRENGTFEGLPMAKDAPFGGPKRKSAALDEAKVEEMLAGFHTAAKMLEPAE